MILDPENSDVKFERPYALQTFKSMLTWHKEGTQAFMFRLLITDQTMQEYFEGDRDELVRILNLLGDIHSTEMHELHVRVFGQV